MSPKQFTPIIIPKGLIWQLNVVATQPVGVPDPMGIVIAIPEGERGVFLGGRVGPNNYGAGRVIEVELRDTGTSSEYYMINKDSVDNQTINLGHVLVSETSTSHTVGVIGLPYMPFMMPELSNITILGTALANTETLTFRGWIATRALPPTRSIIGAAVTLTTDVITQV